MGGLWSCQGVQEQGIAPLECSQAQNLPCLKLVLRIKRIKSSSPPALHSEVKPLSEILKKSFQVRKSFPNSLWERRGILGIV